MSMFVNGKYQLLLGTFTCSHHYDKKNNCYNHLSNVFDFLAQFQSVLMLSCTVIFLTKIK